jgi:hypothetical protein
MHGGAKGSGAPKGRVNGNFRSGEFTSEAIQLRRAAFELLRRAKILQKVIDMDTDPN